MVKLLHAVIADAAVGAARRPVEAAGCTPFHAHLDALDLHCLIKRGSEVIFLVLIFLSSWEYAWVHEGGHAEVGQHKEEDDSIVDGNDWGDVEAEPRAREGKEEGGGSH